MYCTQAKALYRNGLNAQASQKSYPCSTCKNTAIAVFLQYDKRSVETHATSRFQRLHPCRAAKKSRKAARWGSFDFLAGGTSV